MILEICVFKNHELGCFTTPNFVDVEPEKAAIQLARTIKAGIAKKDPKAYDYRFLELLHIGSFDDETGKIIELDEPVSLLDCRLMFAPGDNNA